MFVAIITFATVLQDGHRGVPSGENCLLLLKVVASNPLSLANPEQDNPFSCASLEIAAHSIWCVITAFLLFFIVKLCILSWNKFPGATHIVI